jgi:hypothetical protein
MGEVARLAALHCGPFDYGFEVTCLTEEGLEVVIAVQVAGLHFLRAAHASTRPVPVVSLEASNAFLLVVAVDAGGGALKAGMVVELVIVAPQASGADGLAAMLLRIAEVAVESGAR